MEYPKSSFLNGPNCRRHQNRILHSVQEFLIGRDDCRQHSSHLRLSIVHEIVRTKPNSPTHGSLFAGRGVKVRMIDQPPMVKPLHDPRMMREVFDRSLYRALPFLVRQIGTDLHTPASPPNFRKTADLQDKITLLLRKRRQLLPILDLQSRDHGMMRNRCWIDDPSHWDHLLQFEPMTFAQLAPPKLPQRSRPEKREP
jgi:hypothetical protein